MAFQNFASIRRSPAVIQAGRAAQLNEPELRARIRQEADGLAVWARHAPNIDSTAGDLTLQVDPDLAIAVAFVLSS